MHALPFAFFAGTGVPVSRFYDPLKHSAALLIGFQVSLTVQAYGMKGGPLITRRAAFHSAAYSTAPLYFAGTGRSMGADAGLPLAWSLRPC